MFTTLLLILTAAFAVLTWKNLHAGLLLLVAVLPSYLLRTEVFGVPTTLLELLVVTFLIVWTIRFLGSRRLKPAMNPTTGRRLKPAATLLPILLLLLASTISVFVAPDLVSALGVWKSYFLEPILLFFVVRYELASTQDTKPPYGAITSNSIFKALSISAIILSLIAIVQWLTGAGLPIPWDIERRVTSVFDYPNALGLFLGPIVIIGFLFLCRSGGWRGAWLSSASADEHQRVEHRQSLHRDRTRRESIFWFFVVLFSSIAIVLAQSEAAIVSIIATLLIAGFLKMTREGLEGTKGLKRLKGLIPLVLLVLLVLLILLLPPLAQKLTLQDYSGQVRLSQWNETIDMLGDHWLLGAGLSGYPTVLEPYHQATHLEIFQYPHNIVLNIWVELGILGLIAFGLLAWQVMSLRGGPQPTKQSLPMSQKRLLRSLSLPRNDTQRIVFLALLQMTIHGLVDVPYFKNDLAILTWILLAIVFTYVRPTTSTTPSR